MLDVGDHVGGEKNEIAIAEAIMLAAGVEKFFRVAANHAFAGHGRCAILRRNTGESVINRARRMNLAFENLRRVREIFLFEP